MMIFSVFRRLRSDNKKQTNKFNTHHLKKLIGLCLVLPALLGTPTAPMFAKTKTPYADKIDETSAAIKALQRTQKQLAKNYDRTQKKIRQLDKNLSKARQNVSQIEKNLAEQEQALANLKLEILQTNADLNTQRQGLKKQLRVAYQQGNPHPLALLLSDEQPGTWEQMAVYHQAFVGARNDKFAQVRELQQQKLKQEQALVSLTETLEAEHLAAQEATKALDDLRAEQLALAKKVNNEKDAAGTSISSLRKELANPETLLAAWKSRQTRSKPFAKQRGKLTWPVIGKVRSAKRGKRSQRQGVFISAKPGTPVKAVHGGQVIFSDWLRGFGLMCIIDHGDGYLSLYGHNEVLTRSAGDRIKAGDTLGQIGQSGGSTASGVYFELRHNGTPTDPKKWLAKR